MDWIWSSKTKVFFGKGCIGENLKNLIQPRSKIFCIYGEVSTVNDDLHNEIQSILDEIQCNLIWEGGISSDSEYDRLIQISNTVAQEKPDLIISVGAISVLNGTKFISCASQLPSGVDAWSEILLKEQYPNEITPFACIITTPACGCEWNPYFTITRKSEKMILSGGNDQTYPTFTLIDPTHSQSITPYTIRNVIFESFVNIIDQCLTPITSPLFDNFFLSTMKELFVLSTLFMKEKKDDEYDNLIHRLILASLFSNNLIFSIGKEVCFGIHTIANQISSNYGIDIAFSLALICPFFIENQFNKRIPILAKAAVYVFDVDEKIGEEERARLFVSELRKFIDSLGLPKKVSDCEDIIVDENDIELVTELVMNSVSGEKFGFRDQISVTDVKSILKKVIF